jgi:uncharacterized membrane protein YgdD (TMEM256/DUF423 family)
LARLFLTLAATSGFLAVALGAFGAHALRDSLDPYAAGVFRTAVEYHFVHTLALLAVGMLCRQSAPRRSLQAAGVGFSAGLVVFCGSLYLLSVTGARWLGAITPIGGIAFLGGWLCLLLWSLGQGGNEHR